MERATLVPNCRPTLPATPLTKRSVADWGSRREAVAALRSVFCFGFLLLLGDAAFGLALQSFVGRVAVFGLFILAVDGGVFVDL